MVRRFTSIFLLVLAGSVCLILQASAGPGNVLPGQPKARLITSFPFQELSNGVILIKGCIDDKPDSLNFILDSGSGGIGLDSATCAYLKLPLTHSGRTIRGIGGKKKVPYANDNTLNLPGGLQVDSLNFHVSDYELISEVYGIKIDGLIGYSMLKRYIVRINYDTHIISVYTPGKIKYGHGGDLLKPIMFAIPAIPAPLRNGVSTASRYYFDTGAGLCMLLSEHFVKDSSLLAKRKRWQKVIPTEGQGLIGRLNMSITVIKGMKVGKYWFEDVPIYLFNDISNVMEYPELGGLIGIDLLRRFNITLNYPAGEIYIIPNTHFYDPFDYSYTGLVIYFIDGKVRITDVMKGSPAEKAGFQPGDLLIAVNNNFSNNIQQYRELLKNAGTKVSLIIMRNKELQIIKLPIKSIL
ncbi:MAG TPA: PDZ domain-containing protein [Chitinophagaceae bacterium]|nr:PDZ domain-containing protein [Chitinophagaceae bacterium]